MSTDRSGKRPRAPKPSANVEPRAPEAPVDARDARDARGETRWRDVLRPQATAGWALLTGLAVGFAMGREVDHARQWDTRGGGESAPSAPPTASAENLPAK